jgi:DNA/RNA-binding domain of Phe-tRNA-synthetase-like protein
MTICSPIPLPQHPLLDPEVALVRLPAPLGELKSPPALRALLDLQAQARLRPDEGVRRAVRQLLQVGGYKPSGRNKPASEHLWAAVEAGRLGPSQEINPLVDGCNAVSLWSGLPISVIDLALSPGPHRIAICPAPMSYVFNPSGQELDLGGLLSLWDSTGPCASPVKDSQRTKTSPVTAATLVVIWGSRSLPGRTAAASSWCHELLAPMGVSWAALPLESPPG